MAAEEEKHDAIISDHVKSGGGNVFCAEAEDNPPFVTEECHTEEGLDEVDSGAEPDEIDLLELGDVGVEFCLVGDKTCSIPLELYDLPDLRNVLSLDVWNECLSEVDRLELARYLPDMDKATFMWTLKELLSGDDFHFGNPVHRLFDMMKGGLCEPRVALYRQGLNMLRKCHYYHQLRNHHNNMVSKMHQIRDLWIRCQGHNIEEKLLKLNIFRSQKASSYEKTVDFGLDGFSSGRDDPDEDIWSRTLVETRVRHKKASQLDYQTAFEHLSQKHNNPKALLKQAKPLHPARQTAGYPPYVQYFSSSASPKHDKANGDMNPSVKQRKEADQAMFNALMQRDNNGSIKFVSDISELRKRRGYVGEDESRSQKFKSFPLMFNDFIVNGDCCQVNQLSDITALTSEPSGSGTSHYFGKKMTIIGNNNECTNDHKTCGKGKKQTPGSVVIGTPSGITDPSDLYWQSNSQQEAFTEGRFSQDIWETRTKRPQMIHNILDLDMKYEAAVSLSNDRVHPPKYLGSICVQNGEPDMTALRGIRSISQSDEAESDSSKHINDERIPTLNKKSTYNGGCESNSGYLGLKNAKFLLGELGERSIAPKSYPFYMRQNAESERDPSPSLSNHLNECDDSDLHSAKADFLLKKQIGLRSAKKRRNKLFANDERANTINASPGCSRASSKRKSRKNGISMEPEYEYDQHSEPLQTPLLEQDAEYAGSHDLGASDTPCTRVEITNLELEAKVAKNQLSLITPTVHTGLPFSVVHLLSAVRVIMTTRQSENQLVISQPLEESIQKTGGIENQENDSLYFSQVHANLPSHTIQEIVNRIRSNPGDPCILETEEPLQDLVRGVLKIFSSKKAPLGAKDWKPLASYRKSIRSWYWIGPISQSSSSDQETPEEVTSPDAWGIPRNILVKLVDSFANWLVSSREFHKQLGNLPAPPDSLFQSKLEEINRFGDQRVQRSSCTFHPSSEEVRDYFRQEEALRYSIPDRAFAYTATDGSKSMVAPLRRCSSKPTSKPREHVLLKPDRPPHVSILCLARDAAARLPGCVGTRSDICTLMRDSQYIVEDVSDSQLNQTVSGALDRLHYEHDPCVRYENDRKIWVYLHRERVEEDFDGENPAASKRFKRQKKDSSQPSDQDRITAASDQDDAEIEPPLDVDAEDIIVDIM